MVNSIPHREDMENARSLACALLSEEIEKIASSCGRFSYGKIAFLTARVEEFDELPRVVCHGEYVMVTTHRVSW